MLSVIVFINVLWESHCLGPVVTQDFSLYEILYSRIKAILPPEPLTEPGLWGKQERTSLNGPSPKLIDNYQNYLLSQASLRQREGIILPSWCI